MTEKTLDSNANGCLILILPLAFLIIFLFTAWPAILALVGLSAGWNVWQLYQWQKWCDRVNPIFHQLILENQGSVTPIDLAMRGNFSGDKAKRYLDMKASEFGATTLDYEEKGKVYYFVTAGTLGSIFDSSEPPREIEPQSVAVVTPQLPPPPPRLHIEQVKPPLEFQTTEVTPITEAQPKIPLEKQLVFGSLIQSELAKRLNVYSSTVYKRRNDPDFPEWSRSKDPDGIAWTYSPDTKEFFPVEESGDKS